MNERLNHPNKLITAPVGSGKSFSINNWFSGWTFEEMASLCFWKKRNQKRKQNILISSQYKVRRERFDPFRGCIVLGTPGAGRAYSVPLAELLPAVLKRNPQTLALHRHLVTQVCEVDIELTNGVKQLALRAKILPNQPYTVVSFYVAHHLGLRESAISLPERLIKAYSGPQLQIGKGLTLSYPNILVGELTATDCLLGRDVLQYGKLITDPVNNFYQLET